MEVTHVNKNLFFIKKLHTKLYKNHSKNIPIDSHCHNSGSIFPNRIPGLNLSYNLWRVSLNNHEWEHSRNTSWAPCQFRKSGPQIGSNRARLLNFKAHKRGTIVLSPLLNPPVEEHVNYKIRPVWNTHVLLTSTLIMYRSKTKVNRELR